MSSEKDRVSIIGGTGSLGVALARRWAQAGVPVVIGSRSPERAAETAARIRSDLGFEAIEGLENRDAARASQVVFITVPFGAQSDNLSHLHEALDPDQVVVDCTVPLAVAAGGKPTRALGVWQGSAAQQAQEMVPEGVAVVAAFHTVGAPVLSDLSIELSEDVLICGDKPDHMIRVAHLVQAISGLRAVNAGPLEMARIVEQLTPLLISINRRYKTHAGIKITGIEAAWA